MFVLDLSGEIATEYLFLSPCLTFSLHAQSANWAPKLPLKSKHLNIQ